MTQALDRLPSWSNTHCINIVGLGTAIPEKVPTLVNHLEILELGSEVWNQWRTENLSVLPDLRGASLRGQQLRGVRFDAAVLAGADLSFADLRDANLSRSDLRGVLLTGADLRNADLRCAVLGDIVGGIGNSVTDITDGDFTGTLFGWTIVGDIYLNRIVGIGRIRHSGPSYISTSTLEFTAREVERTGTIRTDVETFLRGAGVLMARFEVDGRGMTLLQSSPPVRSRLVAV